MKRLLLPALLAACLAAPAAWSGAALAAPLAQAPQIAFDKYTLPNGLQVILVEDHKLPIVAVNLWYHVGPANEGPGLTGFAHLFEHMMFAGTRHVPRGLADRLLEGAGVTDSNGSTDFDRTNYYDTVPSNQLELALWIHSDRMGYLLDVLDQKALSNQQDVVRNERRQTVENRPYGVVEEALYHNLFPKNHPYHAYVIGSHADIQNARLADVRAFFTRYYSPNNASLVIAGDIDKARTRALIDKYFGSFKRGPEVAPPQVLTPPITAEKRLTVHDRVELPRVFMGWLTSPAFKPGDIELAVAAQVLGGGKSSRLYKSLVYDKQIAQDVNAAQSSNLLASTFVVDVTARPGHTAAEIEAAIQAELEDLRTRGPSEKEVERARNTIETGMLMGMEKLGGQGLANQLNLYNQYTGDPGYVEQDLARVRRVSAADVRAVMAAQLGDQARVVVHGLPGEPVLAPDVPVPPARPRLAHRATPLQADEAWRYQAPQPGPAPQFSLPTGESFRLANGLTVIHHYNPALPMLAAELVLKAGSEASPVTRPGLAGFTAQMLEEGTQQRSSQQIADEIAQLGALFGASSGPDAARVTLLSLSHNFAQGLDVLADVVQHPSFPEAEIERQRAARLGDLVQIRENPAALTALAGAMAMYGPQHPYGYGQIGTEAAIRATSRADLLGFWQRHYVPANAALIVAGDITREQLRSLAEAKFGQWQGTAPAPLALPPAQPTQARVVFVDKPGAAQTGLRVVAPGPARDTPDYPVLEVMNGALGGMFSSRLNNNLRETRGYSYGMFSSFGYRRLGGQFVAAGSVRNDVAGASVREMLKELNGMRARPLGPAELANARNAQVLSLPGLFETNRAVGASLANVFLYGLDLRYYQGLPQQFATVTAAQAQAAARRYLDPAHLIVVAAGDKKTVLPQLARLRLGPIEERDADGQRK
ncbi:pitrilysin family protein [Massilia sp. TS11]|uniref:M16 family metallopeptidase n=1 Tax=Massilia sp. TS11 TaxID=2908003 RepID=UPI001EDA72F1|nr:pitrilysin family protein [Massilia sp. TS11]MCG2586406.1 insulinase family protein [Massilia sp. TS11]